MTIEAVALVRELAGTDCRCGRKKRSKQSFCGLCYSALPADVQRALYRRVGRGYEEAFAAAVAWLKGGLAGDAA